MGSYKEFFKKGTTVRYFPDEKILLLKPGNNLDKDAFLRLKSSLDTLLKITGTKRTGNSFSLKLDDQFNVDIDEVLKSLGMKGGLEREDASSMVDDASKDNQKEQQSLQSPEASQQMEQPQIQQQPQQDVPQMESLIKKGVYHFLFEDDLFKSGPTVKDKRKLVKRPGKYWKPIEQQIGKNRHKIIPEDIFDLRKKFAIKPYSTDRNFVLRCLDKAENYFYRRIMVEEGELEAEEFHEKYLALDDLSPTDYEDKTKMDDENFDANISGGLKLPYPNFDEIDYDPSNIER